jgi:hypothetical protein
MSYYEIGEVEQIITPDGVIYALNDGYERAVSAIGGRGMPGINYDSFQGYQQPYPIVTDWILEPRSVVIMMTMSNTTRDEYWQKRYNLMQALRFNRGGPFTLRHIRADGTRRDLYCLPDSSPIFPDDISLWAGEQVEISLIAHDPLFKDASDTIHAAAFSIIDELQFPSTFPILFKSESYNSTINISYTGTFVSYPVISISGPYTWMKLTHLQTGAYIGLEVPILAGETRIIDLTPRAQSVHDGMGTEDSDKFGDLEMPESNLITFNLRPKGTAWRNSPFAGIPDGLNQIWFQAEGVTSATQIAFNYRAQYIDLT